MDADSLIALGPEHGCEFSAEDLAAVVELSDEESGWCGRWGYCDSDPTDHSVSVANKLGKPVLGRSIIRQLTDVRLAVAPMETIFRLGRGLKCPAGVWTRHINN